MDPWDRVHGYYSTLNPLTHRCERGLSGKNPVTTSKSSRLTISHTPFSRPTVFGSVCVPSMFSTSLRVTEVTGVAWERMSRSRPRVNDFFGSEGESRTKTEDQLHLERFR